MIAVAGCISGPSKLEISQATPVEESSPPALATEDQELRNEIVDMFRQHLDAPRSELLEEIETAVTQLLHARNVRMAERAAHRIEALEAEIAQLCGELHESVAAAQNAGVAEGRARPNPHHAIREAEGAQAGRKDAAEEVLPAETSAFLGCSVQPVAEELARTLQLKDPALKVTKVIAGSPAARLGLRPGDVITDCEGKAPQAEDISKVLRAKRPGDWIAIKFIGERDGKPILFKARTPLADREDYGEALREKARGGPFDPAASGPSGGREEHAREASPSQSKAAYTLGDLRNAASGRDDLPQPRFDAGDETDGLRLGATVSNRNFALEVLDLAPNGMAAGAGILPGDRLLRIDGRRVRTLAGVKDALLQLTQNDNTTIQFLRGKRVFIAELLLDPSRRYGTLLRTLARDASEEEVAEGGASGERAGVAFLGVNLANLPGSLEIAEVLAQSPAELMGLRGGDRIIKVNDAACTDSAQFRDFLRLARAGDAVRFTVRRGSEELLLEGRLGARATQVAERQTTDPVAASDTAAEPDAAAAGVGVRHDGESGAPPTANEPPRDPSNAALAGAGIAEPRDGDNGESAPAAGSASGSADDSHAGSSAVESASASPPGESGEARVNLPVRDGADVPALRESRTAGDDVASGSAEGAPAIAEDTDRATANSGAAALAPAMAQPVPRRRFGITARLEFGRIRIDRVDPQGSATKAGLRSGDYIVSIDNREMHSFLDLESVIADWENGEELLVSVERNGQKQTFCVQATMATPASASPQVPATVTPTAVTPTPSAGTPITGAPSEGISTDSTQPASSSAGGAGAANATVPHSSAVENAAPHLGISLEAFPGYLRVASLDGGGPADRAGLRAGDHIVAVGEQLPGNLVWFQQLLGRSRPGETLTLRVRRSGEKDEISIDLVLGTH